MSPTSDKNFDEKAEARLASMFQMEYIEDQGFSDSVQRQILMRELQQPQRKNWFTGIITLLLLLAGIGGAILFLGNNLSINEIALGVLMVTMTLALLAEPQC